MKYLCKLGVNIDHVATIRQQRQGNFPDVFEAARVVKKAGAHSVTVHLREDRRHIQVSDVWDIKKKAGIPLNLEMAATDWMINFASKLHPESVCLVPEKRQELTTEGGLDVVGQSHSLRKKIDQLRKAGIVVSLFIDPEHAHITAAYDTGADAVELHTGAYARHRSSRELKKIKIAAQYAYEKGLIVNAGHGLSYENVRPLLHIPGLYELNIGFSIISRALFVGLEQAVKEMLQLLK